MGDPSLQLWASLWKLPLSLYKCGDAMGKRFQKCLCFVVPTNIQVFICNPLQGES